MTDSGLAQVQLASSSVGAAADVDYSALVAELRVTFNTGKTKDIAWRRSQLQQVQAMFRENHEAITEALLADHHGPKLRGIMELGSFQAAEEALANLDSWTSPETVHTPFIVSPTRMGRSMIRKEPKGVVLVVGPWNFPFELCFHPLVSAIAAGNCVLIKPSEVAPHSAAMIQRLAEQYLDQDCIRVVQGAVPETTALLKQQWDHIFYTGNGSVGKIVLKAAAEHLTPVTLELGGKSPVIIDKSAKMASVISRVSATKWLNAGQICVAPDYVLVHEDREQEFLDAMKQYVTSAYGADPKTSKDFGRVINAHHVRRLQGMLSQTHGHCITGGVDAIDAESHYVPPTVVAGVAMDEPLMREEIFGPVLPVMSVSSMEEAVAKVNAICDHPLALYVYSEDAGATATVLDGTTSGGGCINSSVEHLTNANLPFGGVGASGYGSYHGKAGFEEFSHRRSILHQDTLLMAKFGLPPPPYKNDSMYDLIVKAQITGFLTDAQKVMLKAGAAAAAVVLAYSRL